MDGLKGARALVTGAGGFLGRHLVERLLAEGASVWPLSRRPGLCPSGVRPIPPGALEHLTPAVFANLGVDGFDLVFHLAAFTPKTPATANDAAAIVSANVLGTQRLLECLPSRPTNFVLGSSTDVYERPAHAEILSEASPTRPPTLYGDSKLFAEALVRHWSEHRQWRQRILRIGNVYGPGDDAYGKFIPATARRLLDGLHALVAGDGSTERDFVYVDDVVEAMVRAASRPGPGREDGPVNVVSGTSVPLSHVASTLAALSGRPGNVTFQTNLAPGPSVRFDPSRMARVLGRWPLTPLEEGLRRKMASLPASM